MRAHRVQCAAAMLPLVFFALTQVTSFGTNPGALTMYEYIPQRLPAGRPLVVVLHGCTQSANAMTAAGWNQLADQYQFAVVYPEQSSANNPVECFNWAGEYGDTANLVRGQGENQSILSMVDYEVAHHGVDASKVYIMGFSAGAAFTTVIFATWPDRGTDDEAPYQLMWDATQAGEHTLVATAHGATQDATAMATVTVASGSGGGGGSNNDNPGPGDLPGCSLDAGKGGLGFAPLAMAVIAVLRRRRQRA